MSPETRHVPVLRDMCVQLLAPALQNSDSVMIDATLGMGGHTEAVLENCPQARVIGIDRDPQALEIASRRLEPFGARFLPFHGTYDQIDEVARAYGVGGLVDAILMDLGVSSLQLDEAERGFAYAQDGPLDMRMDPTKGISAQEYLATVDESELVRVLRTYGEERFAPRIAAALIRRRQEMPLAGTAELADLVREAIPAAGKRKGGNPAKRTFQAIRIAVNDELGILERTLPRALSALRPGGRIVVESYQSLEDRLVKRTFAEGFTSTAPLDLPVIPESDAPRLKALTHGALKADEAEIARNPRAKSVRLRAAELIAPWGNR